jgi:polyphosphate glucokinase
MSTTCPSCVRCANGSYDDRLRRGWGAVILPDVKILVIDIGGSHVKLLATGRRTPIKVPSGPNLTAARMVEEVREATEGWSFDAVSIGYPGPVARNRPTKEPVNLGDGWVRYNYQRAFGVPVRMINDAAMQALGSYAGRTMLFLGLGTGLGTTLVTNSVVVPLELAHLPFANGKSYEDTIGEAGLKRSGKRKWRRNVRMIVDLLSAATNADYTVLGGGNVRFMDELPPNTRRGNNANAFRGGFRLWDDEATQKKRAR